MLLRLHVRGFKNLQDVEIWFGPFTCIVGENAVGKSNVFDAIRFLSLLTERPIMESVKQMREAKGRAPQPDSIFTAIGTYRAPEVRFTADMVIPPEVQDEFGASARATSTALKYEVAFRLSGDGPQRLELFEESLRPMPVGEADTILMPWSRAPFRQSVLKGNRRKDYISTTQSAQGPVIEVHQDGHGGRHVPAPKSSRTVLGASTGADFPTVLAARREMQSWRTLMLEPSAMRAPSDYHDERVIDLRGANVPAAIWRLKRGEKSLGAAYAELTNRLGGLLPDVQGLRIRDDEKTETLTLEIAGRDGVFHPARSLSDGTLRFLVLATLAQDPEAQGVICLEEPENGVHPARIPVMVTLLRDIAVDPQECVDIDNPLRQVIVNTHSGEVVKCVSPEELVSMESVAVQQQGVDGIVATVRVPDRTWRSVVHGPNYNLAPGRIRDYIEQGQADSWLQGQLLSVDN